MAPSPSVRRFAPHEWRAYRDLRLRSLAESPDAFGSTLAAERDRPDAEWATRLAPSETDMPLIAEVDEEPTGLAWGRIEASARETAHLYQMWVAPAHRGRGVGWMLVDGVIQWARAAGVYSLRLCVTCGDTPATRLYARAGFIPTGLPAPLRPGAAVLAQSMYLPLSMLS